MYSIALFDTVHVIGTFRTEKAKGWHMFFFNFTLMLKVICSKFTLAPKSACSVLRFQYVRAEKVIILCGKGKFRVTLSFL